MSLFAWALVVLACCLRVDAQLPMPYPTGELGRGVHCVTEKVGEPIFTVNYTLFWDQFTLKWYLLPDNIYAVQIDALDASDIVSDYQQASDYFSAEVSSWGLGAFLNIDGVNLDLMLGRTHGAINDRMEFGQRYFHSNERSYFLYQLSMFHNAQIGQPFMSTLAALPKQYDPQAYSDFLTDYGTMILTTMVNGGTVNLTLAYDYDLIVSKGAAWTSEQVAASIGFFEEMLDFGGQWSGNTTYIDEDFIAHSSYANFSVGGDQFVLNTLGFSAWLGTVPAQPASFLPHTHPLNGWQWIFDFVQPIDPIRAANLRQAVKDVCSSNGTTTATIDTMSASVSR